MISKQQIQLVQIARRDVQRIMGERNGTFDDAAYRLLLRSVAHVESCKDPRLDQVGFEAVMAQLESMGFRQPGASETKWRDIADRQGRVASTRQVHEIRRLARQQSGRKYDLAGLCKRWSGNRTWQPEKLLPAEAHKLIEMLKDCVLRNPSASHVTEDDHAAPTLF